MPYRQSGKADFDLLSEQIKIKLDIINKGMGRLGMHADQLDSLEVLDLFYSFYSPTQAKIQPLTEQALQIIHTALVKSEQKGTANRRPCSQATTGAYRATTRTQYHVWRTRRYRRIVILWARRKYRPFVYRRRVHAYLVHLWLPICGKLWLA